MVCKEVSLTMSLWASIGGVWALLFRLPTPTILEWELRWVGCRVYAEHCQVYSKGAFPTPAAHLGSDSSWSLKHPHTCHIFALAFTSIPYSWNCLHQSSTGDGKDAGSPSKNSCGAAWEDSHIKKSGRCCKGGQPPVVSQHLLERAGLQPKSLTEV